MKSTTFTVDPYGSARVSEKTTLIDIKPFHCCSDRRDKIVTAGTGSVTNDQAQFIVAISGTSDSALLTSLERGEYVAGCTAETGIGLQVDPAQFTGAQTLNFGYFDDSNGFFFVVSNTGLSLAYRKGGVTTGIPRSSWNGDYCSNSPPDIAKGLIYRINFSWYGLGAILFSVNYGQSDGSQVNRLIHSYAPASGLSCMNPHLPIRVELLANGSSDPVTAYIAGRQYSVIGKYKPMFRVTSRIASATSVSSSAFIPLFSLRRKTMYLSCRMSVHSFDIIASHGVIVKIVTDATLTDSTFDGTLEDIAECESSLELDVAATGAENGIVLYACLVAAGAST
ncbi:unnamed protein product, partial [Phaeothamnion confervicola]